MRVTTAMLLAGLLVGGCGGGEATVTRAEQEAMAQKAAPLVKSFLARGAYRSVEGEPAVTVSNLVGKGDGAVQVLAGRSRPGANERMCPSLGIRLAPSGERGRELLPIVADAFETAHETSCGIP